MRGIPGSLGTVLLVVVGTSLAGCADDPDAPRPRAPGPPRLILERAPAEVRETCREIAARATETIYCPERIPAPKGGRRYLGVDEQRNVQGDEVVGVEISWTAEPQPALQNTFMHVYILPTSVLPYLPKKSRTAEIAGRRGTFYPATGHDAANNHFNFSCHLDSSTEYWVSVHRVGRGSRQLLDAIVRNLEPVGASA